MKKTLFMSLAVALLLALCFTESAHAITYTVSSQESFTDDFGNSKRRVSGTIAWDSNYPCNTTTGRCGEDLIPSQIGLTSIDSLDIGMVNAPGATGGALFFKYHSAGVSGSGGTGGNIRAYYTSQGVAGVTAAAFISAPTYDLSAVTSSPFKAVGSI